MAFSIFKTDCVVDSRLSQKRSVLMLLIVWRTDDNRTDLLSHTLTIKGSEVTSLVKFRPVVQEEIAWRTDGQTVTF